MTLSPEVLSGLSERILAATWSDAELDIDLCIALSYIGYTDAPINLRRASSDDGWLDYEIVEDGHRIDCSDQAPELTGSIDAALALVTRLLPGWKWGVSSIAVRTGGKTAEGYPRYGEGFRAHVTAVSALRSMPSIGEAPTAPLAILLALLTALQENMK